MATCLSPFSLQNEIGFWTQSTSCWSTTPTQGPSSEALQSRQFPIHVVPVPSSSNARLGLTAICWDGPRDPMYSSTQDKTGTRLSGLHCRSWKKAKSLHHDEQVKHCGWLDQYDKANITRGVFVSRWARIHPQRFMVTKSCKECVSLDASLLTNSSVQSSLPNLNYQ